MLLRFNGFPIISEYESELLLNNKFAMRGTISNMGYVSTPEQVTLRRNVQYSQFSNSSENLCLSLLSASLKKKVSAAY